MTPFKQKVLQVVSKIPRGQTMSYREVAKGAGYPRAYRAVGSIMSHNVDPGIPCHRVVRSDGVIGSYNRGGPRQKQVLLVQEGTKVKKCGVIYRIDNKN